jgi:hypothetical protein
MISAFPNGGALVAKAKRRRLVAWSKDDVKNLRAFAKSRLSGTQAAKKLRRSPGAVAQKAMKLKIRFRSNRRKVG